MRSAVRVRPRAVLPEPRRHGPRDREGPFKYLCLGCTRPLFSHGQEPILVATSLPLRWALGELSRALAGLVMRRAGLDGPSARWADSGGGGGRRRDAVVTRRGWHGPAAARRARPSAARSRRTAWGSVTAPRIRRGPPQRSQTRTSIANTRRRSRAQGHRLGDRPPASAGGETLADLQRAAHALGLMF